jgi:hypothetical protein
VGECLASKLKALSSNPSIEKNKNKTCCGFPTSTALCDQSLPAILWLFHIPHNPHHSTPGIGLSFKPRSPPGLCTYCSISLEHCSLFSVISSLPILRFQFRVTFLGEPSWTSTWGVYLPGDMP